MTPQPEPDPLESLQQLISGYWLSRAIHTVVELGIPDLLAAGPHTAEDLAARTGAHPEALARVLRSLTLPGVFDEVEPGRFALTQSMRSMVLCGSVEDARQE
jgi:hypothetical protein